MKTSKDRLIEFLAHLKIGQNAFEKNCDISNGYISNNKGSIGSAILAKIVFRYPDLNAAWLLSGEGVMLKSDMGSPIIDSLLGMITVRDMQIAEKDRQIAEKDAQIKRLFDLLEKK